MKNKKFITIPFEYSDANKIKIKGIYKLDKEANSLIKNQEKLLFEKGFRNEIGNIMFNINNVIKASYTEYWNNGNIKIRGQYKNGQKNGCWDDFNDSGKLIITEYWMTNNDGKEFNYGSIKH